MIMKSRTHSGVVCEQIVYHTSDRIRSAKSAKLHPRFADEAARKRHRDEIARKRHVQMFNETFANTPLDISFYATLTFDTAHEVHTFEAAKCVRDNYIRRLRYAHPDSVIFAYVGRGNKYERIHLHMVSAGIPAETIIAKWNCGTVMAISPLREHNYYKIEGERQGRSWSGLHWAGQLSIQPLDTRGGRTPLQGQRPRPQTGARKHD